MYMLAHGRILDDDTLRRLFRETVPEGIAIPTQSDVNRMRHPDDEVGRTASAQLEAFAEALRSDTDILDYALLISHKRDVERREEAGASGGSYYVPMRDRDLRADRGEFVRFKESHAAFDAAHGIETDARRIAELRRLRARLVDAAPKRLVPEEIAVNLGSPWIPASIYYQFASETFKFDEAYRYAGSSDAAAARWMIMRSPRTGSMAGQIRRCARADAKRRKRIRHRGGEPALPDGIGDERLVHNHHQTGPRRRPPKSPTRASRTRSRPPRRTA